MPLSIKSKFELGKIWIPYFEALGYVWGMTKNKLIFNTIDAINNLIDQIPCCLSLLSWFSSFWSFLFWQV